MFDYPRPELPRSGTKQLPTYVSSPLPLRLQLELRDRWRTLQLPWLPLGLSLEDRWKFPAAVDPVPYAVVRELAF